MPTINIKLPTEHLGSTLEVVSGFGNDAFGKWPTDPTSNELTTDYSDKIQLGSIISDFIEIHSDFSNDDIKNSIIVLDNIGRNCRSIIIEKFDPKFAESLAKKLNNRQLCYLYVDRDKLADFKVILQNITDYLEQLKYLFEYIIGRCNQEVERISEYIDNMEKEDPYVFDKLSKFNVILRAVPVCEDEDFKEMFEVVDGILERKQSVDEILRLI